MLMSELALLKSKLSNFDNESKASLYFPEPLPPVNKKSCWSSWWKIWSVYWWQVVDEKLLSDSWIKSCEQQKPCVSANIEKWGNFVPFINADIFQSTNCVRNSHVFSSVTTNIFSSVIEKRFRDTSDNKKRRKNHKLHVSSSKFKKDWGKSIIFYQIYKISWVNQSNFIDNLSIRITKWLENQR